MVQAMGWDGMVMVTKPTTEGTVLAAAEEERRRLQRHRLRHPCRHRRHHRRRRHRRPRGRRGRRGRRVNVRRCCSGGCT